MWPGHTVLPAPPNNYFCFFTIHGRGGGGGAWGGTGRGRGGSTATSSVGWGIEKLRGTWYVRTALMQLIVPTPHLPSQSLLRARMAACRYTSTSMGSSSFPPFIKSVRVQGIFIRFSGHKRTPYTFQKYIFTPPL